MTWWHRHSGLIWASWLASLIVALFVYRWEKTGAVVTLSYTYLNLRPSFLVLGITTAAHGLLWKWQDKDDGWLFAIWLSLVYATIIILLVIWRLSQTFYV